MAVVAYGGKVDKLSKPQMVHLSGPAESSAPKDEQVISHSYPNVKSASFTIPQHVDYRGPASGLAHSRSLAFIKKHVGGPYFDLESIWDEHTYFEFADRSAEKTMATMVAEPYVNHVPTVSISGKTPLSHLGWIS